MCEKQPGWKHFRPPKKFARPHPPGSRPSPECGHPDQPMTSPPTGCQRGGLRKECSLLGTTPSNWVLATFHPEGQKAKCTPEATKNPQCQRARGIPEATKLLTLYLWFPYWSPVLRLSIHVDGEYIILYVLEVPCRTSRYPHFFLSR